MDKMQLLSGARKIMDCGNVQPREKVVIVTDTERPASISKALFAAVKEREAEPVIVMINPVAPGGDLPRAVDAALKEADLVLTPTSTSLYHTKGVREAHEAPHLTRVIALSEITEDALVHGGITADFRALRPLVEKLGEIYTGGKTIRYVTPAGTDLRADIAGREAYWISGMADQPGMLVALPTTEVYIAPVEESVEGKIVVDASCSGGIGLVDEPMVITVEKGKIISIEGGKAAAKLRKKLEEQNTLKAYQIAEFGLGLNPKCRVLGTTEDEGRYGTCHFGIGSNVGFGGLNHVPIHLDVICWKPTVEIDGKAIFENGENRISYC